MDLLSRDNPVNEALNGWIKEELCVEFQIEQHWKSPDAFKQTIKRYVNYYNTQRPCFAIGYDTPENYRKLYYKGELPKKQTFENRILNPEPNFVQKRRQLSDNKDTYEDVSTFEKEKNEKSREMSTFVNPNTIKKLPMSTFVKTNN